MKRLPFISYSAVSLRRNHCNIRSKTAVSGTATDVECLVEADIAWRIVAAMSVAAIYRALPTVKAKTVGSCFLRRQRRKNMGAARWHTKVLVVQI